MEFQKKYGSFEHIASGKVREVYLSEENDEIMMVATDRVSAFDQKLGIEIPDKGKILTAISAEFACLAQESWGIRTAYHYAGTPCSQVVVGCFMLRQFKDYNIIGTAPELSGRFTLMENLQMFPVECIVRGYLFGSIWKLYEQGERVICGVKLPDGLVKGSKLEEPIFTPTTKAPEGEHDENITLEEMTIILGKTSMVFDAWETATEIRDLCIELYQKAGTWAYKRGLIIADTKFELGLYRLNDEVGVRICFGDEILTPDSSRFWDAETYVPGEEPKSYDKQIIRDYLAEAQARGEVNPTLPADIIEKTRQRYIELYEKLFDKTWPKG